jgi:Zn-dependent protease
MKKFAMDTIKQKASALLWIIIPVCCTALYPYCKSDARILEWLTTGLLIYVLFFSVVIHELCHGFAARFCGDPTAEDSGRLTLNPLRHVSLIGSFIVPLVLYLMKAPAVIGWAKPVPFDPAKLKHFPRDQVLLAISGPLANFVLAYVCFCLFLISGFIFNRLFPGSQVFIHIDIFTPLAFGDIPFEPFWFVFFELLSIGMVVNIVLGAFNLIPFPPLDGSWILKALLPKKAALIFAKFQSFGFIFLLLAVQFHLLEFFLYPMLIILMAFQQVGNLCLR